MKYQSECQIIKSGSGRRELIGVLKGGFNVQGRENHFVSTVLFE